MNIVAIDTEALKEICGMTVSLTKVRQSECKHLCVENFAPELFGTLLDEYLKRAKIEISQEDLRDKRIFSGTC